MSLLRSRRIKPGPKEAKLGKFTKIPPLRKSLPFWFVQTNIHIHTELGNFLFSNESLAYFWLLLSNDFGTNADNFAMTFSCPLAYLGLFMQHICGFVKSSPSVENRTDTGSSEDFVFISSYGVASETGHPPVLDAWTIKACIRMNATFIDPLRKKKAKKKPEVQKYEGKRCQGGVLIRSAFHKDEAKLSCQPWTSSGDLSSFSFRF